MTPAKILKQKIHHLTPYEQNEILDYPQVYYFGEGVSKIKPDMTVQKVQNRRGSEDQDPNFGFDDSKGNYRITTGDHIAFRYEITGFLGKGSFGIAVECFDHKTKEKIAIKIIKNKKKYYYQAGVELKIL